MTAALIRKEFLELRWKLLALIVLPIFVFLVTVYHAGVGGAITLATCCEVFLSPTIAAMSFCSTEQQQRTREFVRSLPVCGYRVGRIRLCSHLIFLLTPIAVFALIGFFLLQRFPPPEFSGRDGFSEPSAFRTVFCQPMVAALGLFAWTSAIAMNQSSEMRTATVGTIVFFVALAITGFGQVRLPMTREELAQINLVSLSFLSPLSITNYRQWIDMIAVPQLLVAASLLCVAVLRFGRTVIGRPRLVRFPTPRLALIWCELRQSASVACVGMIISLAVAASSMEQHVPGNDYWNFLVTISCILAITLGAGSFCLDLDSQLRNFWQTRPILMRQWFRTKFATGIAVVSISVLTAPLLKCALIVLPIFMRTDTQQPGLPIFIPAIDLTVGTQIGITLAAGCLMILLAYTVAVFCACLVRNMMYAGILSVAIMVLITVLPAYQFHIEPVISPNFGRPFWITMSIYAGATITLFALAERAVERNWDLSMG